MHLCVCVFLCACCECAYVWTCVCVYGYVHAYCICNVHIAEAAPTIVTLIVTRLKEPRIGIHIGPCEGKPLKEPL